MTSGRRSAHFVSAVMLDPIDDTTAVVPELRKVLATMPITQVRRATQGKVALYVYDNRDPQTSKAVLVEVCRTIRNLGLRGRWMEYRDGDLTGSGRFGAERA